MGYFKLRIAFGVLIMVWGINTNYIFAQEIPEIDMFSEINGDFQQIKGIQQDEQGNLWIASEAHIEKYNSHESHFFNNFKGLPKNTGELNTIFIDSRDNIWIGAEKGLIKYDPVKDRFLHLPFEGPNAPNIYHITEGDKGTLWLGASDGIWQYQDNILKSVASFPEEQRVTELLSIGPNLIFATSNGLFKLNKVSWKYNKINFPRQLKIESLLYSGQFFLIGTRDDGIYRTYPDFNELEKVYSLPYSSNRIPITGISMDKGGNFYVASKGDGIYGLDKNLKLIAHYVTEAKNPLSLADNYISGLHLDKFNTLYIATESGQINSLNLRENIFTFIKNDPGRHGSLADNFTTAIEKDRNGKVWFGTRQGLSIWNPNNETWQHIKTLSFTGNNAMPDVIKDLKADDEHMWVATYNDGVYKVNINTFLRAHYSIDSKIKISLQRVNALYVDASRNVWAGGAGGDLTQIRANGEISSYSLQGVNALRQLAGGDMIAAGKSGVYRIRRGRNEIIPIRKLESNANDLPYFTINAIGETARGEVVLATEGAGIVIYDPAGDSYRKIDQSSGMPSDRIRGLIIYEGDEIWAGTSKGLVNFKMEEESEIRVFDKNDGLLSNIFTRGSFAKLDNKLAFGTFKGVSLFNPENLKSFESGGAPNVIIGSVNINSRKKGSKLMGAVQHGSSFDLDHDENTFKFNFYGLQPGNNKGLKYSWKLEGYDKEWTKPSGQNEVSYANLPPGNYTFLVKAGTLNGTWSPATAVTLDISSPWWASTPAYIAAVVLLLLLIGFPFVIIALYRKRRAKAARSSFYNNLHQELGTPLTILMASLDDIANEEDQKNRNRIKNIISRLKELFEPVLDLRPVVETKNELLPQIQRIVVSNYLKDLQKDLAPLLRDKKLEIIINNQWNKEFFYYDIKYLNKIFFNIISNSVKYSFEDGKIIINLIQTNRGDLKVQIADNGLGLPVEDQKVIRDYFRNPKSSTTKGSSEGINLLYVKDFIDKLGGSIVFESSKDQGTTFTLILKNHHKAPDVIDAERGGTPVISTEGPVVSGISAEVPATSFNAESPATSGIKAESSAVYTERSSPTATGSEISEEAGFISATQAKNEYWEMMPPVPSSREITPDEPLEAELPRILIAEDNDELRKVFHESLKKLGHIYEARNGMEAFEIATQIKPHIIIADLDMPGLDGLALSKALKNNNALAEIPVYLMISEMEKMQLPHSTRNEILNIISKPVNMDSMFEIIAVKLNARVSIPFRNSTISERNSNILKGGLDDNFAVKLEKFIVRNISNKFLSIDDISAAMGLTPAGLYNKLKTTQGITLEEFVLLAKLNYAREMIARGNPDLGEVARMAGFQNRDVFFTAYKKQFGFMPGTIIEK